MILDNLILHANVWESLLHPYFIKGIVGPLFLFILAYKSLDHFAKRQIRELFTLVGIAIVVALFIYFPHVFFSENGLFVKEGKGAAEKVKIINTLTPYFTSFFR